MQHLEEAFQRKGYPERIIKRALYPKKQPEPHVTEDSTPSPRTANKKIISLPYIKRTTERLGKICLKHGLIPVFRYSDTLREIISHPKKNVHKYRNKGVIYRIPCKDCREVYIGETGRPLSVRITEHQCAVQKRDKNNANSVHTEIMGHTINWKGAHRLDREPMLKLRKIKESLHIKQERTYNLDQGVPIHPTWDSLFGIT